MTAAEHITSANIARYNEKRLPNPIGFGKLSTSDTKFSIFRMPCHIINPPNSTLRHNNISDTDFG